MRITTDLALGNRNDDAVAQAIPLDAKSITKLRTLAKQCLAIMVARTVYFDRFRDLGLGRGRIELDLMGDEIRIPDAQWPRFLDGSDLVLREGSAAG